VVDFLVAEDSPGTSEAAWRRAFAGRDIPVLQLEQTWSAAVVVSAHPDDDVLAIGDLLRALHAGGTPLHAVVATDGERSAPETAFGSAEALGRHRRDELRGAYQHLGIAPSLTWLAIPDGDVARYESDVVRHLRQIVTPETLVLAPWHCDGHPDHDAIGRAAVDVATSAGATLWEFPVWAWHWAEPEGDAFPWWRVRQWPRNDLERKRDAIDCFSTQVRPVGDATPPAGPVLPAAVLDRFHRSFEVVFT
jgi:LmbE family N-acetylglucosaminyl deacetylase